MLCSDDQYINVTRGSNSSDQALTEAPNPTFPGAFLVSQANTVSSEIESFENAIDSPLNRLMLSTSETITNNSRIVSNGDDVRAALVLCKNLVWDIEYSFVNGSLDLLKKKQSPIHPFPQDQCTFTAGFAEPVHE